MIDLTPMSKINVSLKICGFFVEKNRCDKLLSREYCVCVKTGMVKTVDFREILRAVYKDKENDGISKLK